MRNFKRNFSSRTEIYWIAIGPQYSYEITYYSNCFNNNYYCPYWTTALSHWIGFATKSRISFVDKNFVIIGAPAMACRSRQIEVAVERYKAALKSRSEKMTHVIWIQYTKISRIQAVTSTSTKNFVIIWGLCWLRFAYVTELITVQKYAQWYWKGWRCISNLYSTVQTVRLRVL